MGPNTARASASGAEVLPDVGDGVDNSAGGGEELNEQGLTAAEQAEFDAMRTGEPPPGDDDGGAGDDDGVGDGDGDALEGEERAPAVREPGEAAAPVSQKPPKTVNYNKYKRELDRANQAIETERSQRLKAEEDRIRLSERVALINEALSARPAEPAVEPEAPPPNPFDEPDIDPDEDFKGAVAQVNRRVKFQNENQTQFVQQTTESNEDRQLKETFERDFRSFAAQDPTILPAYQFLKDSRLTEICITKFDKDPNDPAAVFTPQEVQEMVNIFNSEEKWVVSEAIKAKKSPAAAILKLAKARGFKPTAPAAAAPAPAPAAPAAKPAPRTPVLATPAAPLAPAGADPAAAAAALAQLRQNRDDGMSLSDGGGAPPGGLTAEILLNMGDAEFAEMVEQMSKHQLDTLMGKMP